MHRRHRVRGRPRDACKIRIVTEIAWRPTPEYVENANVTRLMRTHGIESIDELRAVRSMTSSGSGTPS